MTPPEGTTTTTTTDDAAPKGAAGTSDTEWKAPENKEAFDKAINDAVEAAKPKVPDKYEGLQLPKDSKLDPKLVERTAATARTLGLSQENAGKLLDSLAQEVTSHAEARVKEITDAYAPGGKGWTDVVEKWNADALADPNVGNGKPEVLEQKKTQATKVAAKFGDQAFVDLLKNDPMGSHPAVIRFLSNIYTAMGEKAMVMPSGGGDTTPKKTSELMYPKKETVGA